MIGSKIFALNSLIVETQNTSLYYHFPQINYYINYRISKTSYQILNILSNDFEKNHVEKFLEIYFIYHIMSIVRKVA